MKYKIGDLVVYRPYGYTAIVIETAVGHTGTKIKPLDYNHYDDWLWVHTEYLELVSS